jgi:hypothetical protein
VSRPASAWEIFRQNVGDVTKAYYELLNSKGVDGQLGVALFRAQKRSTAAKQYRGRRFRSAAYDVKNWSLSEICRILGARVGPYRWGWKHDPNTPGFEQVLYVELPTGQCSFHSADRLAGPDFEGEWSGVHNSTEVILSFCDLAMTGEL